MPESDPPNVVSNLINNVALPFAKGLEEELKGVGAELDRERHIASEFDKLEVRRTTGGWGGLIFSLVIRKSEETLMV